jgi:hypothetical protein
MQYLWPFREPYCHGTQPRCFPGTRYVMLYREPPFDEYVMLMSIDSACATDRVQCTCSYGEGVPIVHAYEMAIAKGSQ